MAAGIGIGIALVLLPLMLHLICRHLRKTVKNVELGDNHQMIAVGGNVDLEQSNGVLMGQQRFGRGTESKYSKEKYLERNLISAATIGREKEISFRHDLIVKEEVKKGSRIEICRDNSDFGVRREIESGHENSASGDELGNETSDVERTTSEIPDSENNKVKHTEGETPGDIPSKNDVQNRKGREAIRIRRARAQTAIASSRMEEIVASWDELINSSRINYRKRARTEIFRDEYYLGKQEVGRNLPRVGSSSVFWNQAAIQRTNADLSKISANNVEIKATPSCNVDETYRAGRRIANNSETKRHVSMRNTSADTRRRITRLNSFPRMLKTKRADSGTVITNTWLGNGEIARFRCADTFQSGTAQLEKLCQNLEKLSEKR